MILNTNQLTLQVYSSCPLTLITHCFGLLSSFLFMLTVASHLYINLKAFLYHCQLLTTVIQSIYCLCALSGCDVIPVCPIYAPAPAQENHKDKGGLFPETWSQLLHNNDEVIFCLLGNLFFSLPSTTQRSEVKTEPLELVVSRCLIKKEKQRRHDMSVWTLSL